jgi:TolB-like protein/Tfp pilus assembly protein PilF
MSFVSELRRRQVFRTAAWYGGFAWFAVEVANTVFPQFGLPGWSVRAVIVAVALGLPVAIALAWSFDLTAAGVRREDAPEIVAVATGRTAIWRIPSFWIALALGAGLTLSAEQAWQRLVRPAVGERTSIAVLPFANLSPDPANAYFADGLHEEIIATLARASSLRVISRTSVEQYRDPKRNLKEIADALEVDLILEGSVRRDSDDLRLTLQLIDGRDDAHLWAETYDRKFQNALLLQKTVAEQVVAAIGTTLSPAEKQLIKRVAPTVPEAYDLYLHALALTNQYATEGEQRAVVDLLDRSIELDPGFAPALALRAKTRVWLRSTYDGDSEALAEGARADIERALALEPGLPEALAARGLYYTYVSRDPERGLIDLTRALSVAPSDADTHNVAGLTLRRLGRFDDAIDHFDEAARLTPGEGRYMYRAFETRLALGRIEELEHERQAYAERFPTDPGPRLVKYFIQFMATGETTGWRDEYERLAATISEDERVFHGVRMLSATGDLAGLAALLERASVTDPEPRDLELELALVYLALGDRRRAEPHLQAAAAAASTFSDDSFALADAAVALELSDRSGEAIRLADRAVQLMPERRDAVNGPTVAMQRAWVLIHSKVRAEEGYRELERVLGSMHLQPRLVAVSPLWLLLRDDARTQQILRSKFPRV